MISILKTKLGILFSALLFALFFSGSLEAKLVYQTASIGKTHSPNSATDVPVLSFMLNSDAEDINVNRLRIKNISNSVTFGGGIKAVRLYRDSGNLGVLEESTDVEIASLPSLSSGANPEQFLSFTNELVSSANTIGRTEKSFLITYDFDETKGVENLLGTANITLMEISASDSSFDLDLATETISPTINSVTITGVRFLNITDISPSVVLPGQKKVPMFAISMAVVGENIGNSSDILFTLYNEYNNFVTESTKEDGIVKASMYFSETPPPEGIEFLDITPKIVKPGTDPSSSFRSKSTFDFSFPPFILGTSFNGFNGGLNGITENFYIYYDIGEDIPVTAETKISAQLIQFSGYGGKSNLPLEWPLSGQELFTASEVMVAGLSLDDISSIIPASTVFGPRNKIPMLKLKLRANHSSATLNAITIINDASVPFQTSRGGRTNIIRVELFEDSDQDGILSTQLDTRIGHIRLGDKDINGDTVNDLTTVEIPIIQELTTTVNGLFISEYDSTKTYPRNKEKIIFVVYESGESINGGLDASGNITRLATAKLGYVDATAILDLGDDEITTNVVTLSGIKNTSPRAASPEANVEFNQGANVALASVIDISPETVIQGELLIPMLSANLVADQSFSSVNIEILNESKSFLADNTGVTKVWIYKDLPPIGSFDGSDTYLGATSSFSNREKAIVSGVPLSLGDNNILVLYSIGQDDKGSTTELISEENIKAQINGITSTVENEPMILGGTTPQPTIPASVNVYRSPIDTVVIDAINVEDTGITFNVKVGFENSSPETITIEDVSVRVYKSKISGLDISNEFTTKLINTKVTSLASGESALQNFNVRHSRALSEGIGFVDATVTFLATPSSSAIVSRYLGSDGWKSAATTPRSIVLIQRETPHDWTYPTYVEGVFYQRGTDTVAFSNGMALRSSDSMIIKFRDAGAFLDTSLIRVYKNGIQVTRSNIALLDVNSFHYDDTTGTLTISNLSESDGVIEIYVSDGTNDLAPISLHYSVSSVVKIIKPLFYPNPYALGSENLILGFNLTQPATVDFYFFNHLGLEVYKTTETYTSTGYHELSFLKTSKVFYQGVFICKMIAKDANGNKSVATAKLSVY